MAIWAKTKENLEIFYNNNKVVCVLDTNIVNDYPKNARNFIIKWGGAKKLPKVVGSFMIILQPEQSCHLLSVSTNYPRQYILHH